MSGDHGNTPGKQQHLGIPLGNFIPQGHKRCSSHLVATAHPTSWQSPAQSYPGLLLQPRHHDHSGCALFPHHPPEITHGLGQGALCGNVGILLAVAIDVVGIDVVAARDACG